MNDYYLTPEDYEAAEANGINQQTAYRRFYQLNWSKERAITQKPRKLNKYTEWVKLAEQKGIKHNTFLNRLARGWDLEKAATTPLQK